MDRPVQIIPVGDRGISVVFGDQIDPEIHSQIYNLCLLLEQTRPKGILEWVPTYGALLIVYEPLETDFETLIAAVNDLLQHIQKGVETSAVSCVEIPVYYGGVYGPDLTEVSAHTGLSPDEVIRLHSAPEYLIHMLGFTPGFPYLGGMDERLETPRLKTPRTKIPAGAVGIAGKQTGVYPSASPGGWQLIGQTPLKLFAAENSEPFLLKAGQKLKFVPIDTAQYELLAAQSADGSRQGVVREGLSDGLTAETGKTPVLEVLQPGPLTTIQDMGRTGYREYGVSSGGVMDSAAMRRANALVENKASAAVLEMTFAGAVLRVHEACLVACCGGTASVQVNERKVAQDRSLWLQSGDTLTIGALEKGLRTYLAVRGGFEGSCVMGSLSTDLKGGFGGYKGRKLGVGDLLSRGSACVGAVEMGKALKVTTINEDNASADIPRIRALKGPQANLFTNADLDLFVTNCYQVTPESDRMGMRLSGATLSPLGGGDILSDGILPGAVQVPGHGQPIVMMADCQTTGGYAKIAQVITADLYKLAQLRPGENFQFEWVTLEMAQGLYKASFESPVLKAVGQHWQLTVNGKAFEVEVEEIK